MDSLIEQKEAALQARPHPEFPNVKAAGQHVAGAPQLRVFALVHVNLTNFPTRLPLTRALYQLELMSVRVFPNSLERHFGDLQYAWPYWNSKSNIIARTINDSCWAKRQGGLPQSSLDSSKVDERYSALLCSSTSTLLVVFSGLQPLAFETVLVLHCKVAPLGSKQSWAI